MAATSASTAAGVNSQTIPVYTTKYIPYNYQDEDGVPKGYSVEIISAFLNALQSQNIATEMEFLPWARTYFMANNTKNALIFSLARTADREDKFHWIGRLLPMPVYLVKHKSRQDIKVNDLENSKLWSVAGILNGAPTLCVEELGYRVINSATERAHHFTLLELGRVDLTTVDFASFGELAKSAGFNTSDYEPVLFLDQCSYDLYLAMNKNSDPEVVAKVRSAWKAIDTNGTVNRVRQSFEVKYKPFQ